MLRKITVLLFLFLIITGIYMPCEAQQSKRPVFISEIIKQKPGEGKVEIIQDRKIDELMSKYVEANSQKTKVTGYSICIYSQSKQGVAKTNASETRKNFILNYPGIDASLRYEAPDWRVFVGNFRSRTDAFRLKKQIEPMFPNAYIVETQIDISKF